MEVKKYYKINARAGSGSADIFIYGVIGDSWYEESVTARQFVGDLRSLEENHDRINVHVNSPGGSVFDGLPIFNALRNSKAEIHTYNDGLAASMGAIILLAGSTVHASKNSLVMLHSPSTYAGGNVKDFQDAIDRLNKVQSSLIESICQKVNMTSAEVEKKWFDYQDHWLTAEEAQNEGLVDDLVEEKARIPENVENRDFHQLVNTWRSVLPPERRSNRLVAFFENLFSGETQEKPNPESEINDDNMDLTRMRAALGASDTATEEEMIAQVETMRNELQTARASLTTMNQDLQTARTQLQTAQDELSDLRNEPGDDPANVDPPLNPHADQDKPAGTFHEAMLACMNLLKK